MAIIVMAVVCSCKSNYICPSYESAYILDQETRHKKFSLFDEDTLPKKDMDAEKNRYLVIDEISYRKKRDEIRTVKMETIFPQVDAPDTLLLAEQNLSVDDIDQLLNDGERMVNHYNVDQIYYMRHFGQYLPMPEEPSMREQEDGQEDLEEEILVESQVKKRKKWQFWKKKGAEVDSLNIGFEEEIAEPEEEELSKKELRRQEELEEQKQEELERARQPKIIDLDDFEEDRGTTAQPVGEGPDSKEKDKKKKKFKLGFGKKNKKEAVELEQ
jgi:hypothetical protein